MLTNEQVDRLDDLSKKLISIGFTKNLIKEALEEIADLRAKVREYEEKRGPEKKCTLVRQVVFSTPSGHSTIALEKADVSIIWHSRFSHNPPSDQYVRVGSWVLAEEVGDKVIFQ